MQLVPRAARLAASIVVACLLALAAALPAHAHSGADRTLPERRLHALEEQVLGREHAAEHARQRRLLRSPAYRRRLARRAAPARARMATVRPPAARAGQWQSPFDLPAVATHAVTLPTGKVLIFSSPVGLRSKSVHAYVWDPSRGTGQAAFTRVDPPLDTDHPRQDDGDAEATAKPVNLFGAGHSLMADGRVLVTGGTLTYDYETAAYGGLRHTYTFDPFTETWQQEPDMAGGRWYPTQALLPDGRTAIVSGQDASGTGAINDDVELFTPPAEGTGPGTITRVGSMPTGYSYPHLFWMPSSRLLVLDSLPWRSTYLDPTRPGVPRTDVADADRTRVWSSAVLMPGGPEGSTEVALIGGYDDRQPGHPATDGTLVLDEAADAPAWDASRIGPLNVPRQSHNTVVLPDGGLVTVGGGSDGQDKWRGAQVGETAGDDRRQVELLDPGARTWRLGAAQAETRAYHSTALLLPDGRVLSAGDDANGGDTAGRSPASRDTAEIYSPPYLFRGDRPRITGAPGVAGYGETIRIDSPDTDVRRAVLVAPGSVTHSVNMGQRHVELEVVRTAPGEGLEVRTPPRADLAPPGHYMLFLLDEEGVPSVARFVRLAPPAPAPAAPPAEAGPGAAGPAAPVEHREASKGGPPAARPRVVLDRVLRTSRRPIAVLSGRVVALPRGARVEAALARRAGGGRCRWWSARDRRFTARASGCATARGWARAKVRAGSWRFALGHAASRRAGLVVAVRVVGRHGRTLTAARHELR